MSAGLSGVSAEEFKRAMRALGGAVCVITAGAGATRTGCTVNTLIPFSADPPMVLASLRRDGSTAREVAATGRLGVSLLNVNQQGVAQRFTGFGGEKGEARFAGAPWSTLVKGGAPLLDDALFNLDCTVDETIERHSHMLVLARIAAVRYGAMNVSPLCYMQGGYRTIAG